MKRLEFAKHFGTRLVLLIVAKAFGGAPDASPVPSNNAHRDTFNVLMEVQAGLSGEGSRPIDSERQHLIFKIPIY